MIKPCLSALLLLAVAACCLGEEPMSFLPKPDYHRDPSDPDWLAYAAQFHGHLGPWATAGLRAGNSARVALKAEGYFDVEVAVEGPFAKTPQSCLLDGLQVSTGATLGKHNLSWTKADEIVVRVTNTRTGQVVEVRPTPELMKLLTSFEPSPKAAGAAEHEDHEDHHEDSLVEELARKVARAPEKEILRISFPKAEAGGTAGER